MSDDGRRLLVRTALRSWKVRRLRRNSRVRVAGSNFRGSERGERIAGRAVVVDEREIEALLRGKYGWQKRVLDFLNRRGAADAWVTIEIVDVSSVHVPLSERTNASRRDASS